MKGDEKIRISLSFFFVLAMALSSAVLMAQVEQNAPLDWAQWRGHGRDGHVAGTDWPEDLAGVKLRWRVPLGKGYPGPIVAGDRVFVVETLANEDAAVRALALDSGRELWRREWPSSGEVPFFAARNGDWVRSTPAFNGETLFVGDMREVMLALDGASGEVRWQVDFPARYQTKVPDFGFSSSPLLDGHYLYVQAANSVLKLDPATGATLWRALAGEDGAMASGAFSSPIIATLAGVRQLVVQTRMKLYGLNPADGAVLWSVDVPNFRGMNILTPVIHGDGVFTSSYKNGSYFYKVTRTGETFTVVEAWMNKATGYMSSPVVVDGHAYLHLGNRRLDCIDLESGESRWRSEPFGEYWSMVVQGDRILALDADGTLHLLQADVGSFRPLASHPVVNEETWGHLAVQGRTLFIRELTAISAWDWVDPQQAQTASAR